MKTTLLQKYLPWIAVGLLALPATVQATAQNFDFSTFVSGSSIASAEAGSIEDYGSNSTIAFTYAGDEFVGSVYYDNQLYSTNLSGGAVTKFGAVLPDSSSSVGEVVVGASLGQAGFATGNLFVGSQANGNVYQYANSGGTPSVFVTLPADTGGIRQIFFDPGSTFGGNMLVVTNGGYLYEYNSSGAIVMSVYIGQDAEGMDIAPGTWGKYAGQLLIGSEGTNSLRAISNTGVITLIPGTFYGAETVSTVPPTLDPTNPLEGFYVANYPYDIQFADASDFTSIENTVIVTDEFAAKDRKSVV